MTVNQSLNQFAQALEQKTLDLIQAGQWAALDAMIAPECQFVTNEGIFAGNAAHRCFYTQRHSHLERRHADREL